MIFDGYIILFILELPLMAEAFHTLNVDDVLNYLPDPILIVNRLGIIIFANHAFLNLLGYNPEEIFNENIVHFLQDSSIFDSCIVDLESEGVCIDVETTFIHKNGATIPTVKNVRMIEVEDEICMFVNIRNISTIDIRNRELERSQLQALERTSMLEESISSTQKELSETRIHFDEILNTINEIIWYIDDQTMQVQYVSQAVEKVFEVDQEAFILNPSLWQSMVHQDDRERVMNFFMSLEASATQTIEFRITLQDGRIVWLNNRIIHRPDLNIFIGITFDITEVHNTQSTIEHMAYHDMLTNLPNRAYLKKQIEVMLTRSKTIKQQMAVMFLDLDNFKYINDTKGHEIGDEILILVSKRISDALDENVTLTRFGGDEFIILLSNIQDLSDIEKRAKALIKSFEVPYHLAEYEFFVSCSIGISLFPEHAQTSSNLIKHADTAMYQAKLAGKNQFIFYNEKMDEAVHEFLHIENLIREGLRNKNFELYFQPVIDAKTRLVAGFEGLLRFNHPQEGFISPEKFIPVAEATGDILALSQIVLESACQFSKRLEKYTDQELFLAINVSARQFQENNFAKLFLKCLKDNNVACSSMKVELTESVIMGNIDIATDQLNILKQAGVHTALDDFGTGYSSFEYLARLPIDTLKIDKSFVINMFESAQNQHIIEAMTSLAHTMNMSVTAEGVESEAHADFLQDKGIDILQGFYISKAIPEEEVMQHIQNRSLFFDFTGATDFNI